MRTGERLRRLAVPALLSAAVAVAGLAAAAQPGRAATSISIELSPLIGSTPNVIQQVTYGGKIGYTLNVENTGDSTVTHVQVAVTSDVAGFFDDDSAICSGTVGGATMVCTPPSGKLRPGGGFTVDFRFTAPPSGSQVVTVGKVTGSAKTVGGPSNHGTTLAMSSPVTTQLVPVAVDSVNTYLRESEGASTGPLSATHPQNFSQQLPPTLLNDAFGAAVALLDLSSTSVCHGCLPWSTQVTVPPASIVTNPGNPFWDGTNASPFTWSMSALLPAHTTVTGVAYRDDLGNLHFPVPSCGPGLPSPAEPICVDTFSQSGGVVSATGKGIENGNLGFG